MRSATTLACALMLCSGIRPGGPAASAMLAAQQPAFEAGRGPSVLIDLGHNSLLGGEPFLSPLARLRDDGYRTTTTEGSFTTGQLAGANVLVIVAPLADSNKWPQPEECVESVDYGDPACGRTIDALVAKYWRHPIGSAFTAAEIDAIESWVKSGGGLLLVFDVFPFPGAIEALISRFGIELSNGFAVNEPLIPRLPRMAFPLLGQAADFSFRRNFQSLADHAITNGRDSSERVDVVASIVGSAFRLPPGGESLFTFGPSYVSLLPEVSWEFSEGTPRQPIGGWSQGGVLLVGKGRLAIFAESGILNHGPRFEELYPDAQNSRLMLNAVHWLSGVLDTP